MLLQKVTDATSTALSMNRATKVLFYTSLAIVGWQVLRYLFPRRFAFADDAVEQSSAQDANAYRRATERWENEGGSTLA
jgi:hypothetical protein